MAKQSCRLGLLVVLLALVSASRGEAILNCTDCGCTFSCTQQCVTDTGFSTCGAQGYPCGGCGNCLTAGQADFVLSLLDQAPRSTPATEDQGRAAARLTWRLAQYAEENGLGEVYTTGTGFRLAKGLARPDLAFVRRERLGAGAPDLVVQFAPSRSGDDATGWLRGGTRAVLVLDPAAHTVKVYRNGSPLQVLGSESVLELPDLLPGWSLRVGDLFQ